MEEEQQMSLIEEILSTQNLNEAIKRVKSNKGASGIDKMTVDQIDSYFHEHKNEIINSIMNKAYRPQPVRRVYIPKSNGKLRPLGIPTVVDRVIQQATSQKLMAIYEPIFSNYSYGFRPNRDCHTAINKVLEYLNQGFEWVIDLDIEKYFDTVNHDKLISILREQVNDSHTLHLIRSFLKAGVMDNGLISSTVIGVPQGGPLSPVLSNIYLDKFDKELEQRGLHFVRYADDCNIFVRSDVSANRVMASVTSWLERKLFLKVSATKSKITRPTNSNYLGFTFFKNSTLWQCKPGNDRKTKLYEKTKAILKRKLAVSQPLALTFTKLNQITRGWINYFRIGSMKMFIDTFGQWLRHKVRVIIIKQWKKPLRIHKNLEIINRKYHCNFSFEDIFKVANSRLGWYRRSGMNVVNYLLSPKVLATENKKKGRPGLVNPLEYYLGSLC
jgi:group II intron reverse transcriptase/maturase